MKTWKWAVLLLVGVVVRPAAAQQPFDLDAYRTFLSAHADLEAGALLRMHDAGLFARDAGTAFDGTPYADSVTLKYELTGYERELAGRHGFMVTERLRFDSFGSAFLDVYKKDLPVFISTDAILHALHMSYDRILMDAEQAVLVPRLQALLASLRGALPALAERYRDEAAMQASLRDLDVYLTVPWILLTGETAAPHFGENEAVVEELLGLVEGEQMADYPLFAETCRRMDFSQFTVRGHYTREPELARYFQAMMWLGRTEVYLTAPVTDACRATEADVQRQTIDALLVAEAADAGDAWDAFDAFESVLQVFVGEADNVTLHHLRALRSATGVERASDLLDAARWRAFQDTLRTKAWAGQRIPSQILVNGSVTEPDYVQPASAFMLLGQRFVIDSYVTGAVVYDRIEYRGEAVRRMLPSTLDVLFALGNDAAGQLLTPELETYHYADHLAALRYLIDSYDTSFWQGSLYNGWLDAIRALNPPAERTHLPAFMQTAAWWQEKMNTQLAAWAQLRHDNLLYAKQSYSGVPGCSYPQSYVEPIPAFYEAVGRFARTASARFGTLEGVGSVPEIQAYFAHVIGVSDTLAVIAQKELDGASFDEAERNFLRRVVFERLNVCYEAIDGWYPRLFYSDPERARTPDLVVADIHTAPADEGGTYVGWVQHVGTGPVEMAVVVATVPGVGPVALAGPVMSYYEHLSTGFLRLTDEAWQTAYATAPSMRPAFVNHYLADEAGGPRGDAAAPMLATGIEDAPEAPVPAGPTLALSNYPNPFETETTIAFVLSGGHPVVELAVFDLQGRRVRQLLQQPLPAGNYTVRWDGTFETGTRAPSGTYFCRLRAGDQRATHVLTLVR